MLDFIRDIFSSFRQASLERVKSPFLGAFVFSWIGFNWPMLAILFFSKVEIEKRISYIEGKFGLDSYLIGPLCTSALIAYLLPKINKLVTKIQDKPNTETIEMSLTSKIKIAELQQSIAEIEARKKLSEKKEERNIEEGIQNIKSDYEKVKVKLASTTTVAREAVDENAQLKGRISEEQSKYMVESEARKKIQQDLDIEKRTAREYGAANFELNAELKKYKNNAASLELNLQSAMEAINKLQNELNHVNNSHEVLTGMFPELFEKTEENTAHKIVVKDNALEYLVNLNKNLKRTKEPTPHKITFK